MSLVQLSSAKISAGARTKRVTAGVVAVLLGSFLLFGTGFAQSNLLHDAAHDTRHGLTFPCH